MSAFKVSYEDGTFYGFWTVYEQKPAFLGYKWVVVKRFSEVYGKEAALEMATDLKARLEKANAS